MRIKKGFTLAEIMIVLSVIGVLTAILLPVAYQSAPNENIMKFKKGHNALLSTIRELVNSDKYYLDGDLGVRADGTIIDASHAGDRTYFCESMADVMNLKSKDCSEEVYSAEVSYVHICTDWSTHKTQVDTVCKHFQSTSSDFKEEMVTTDGIIYYASSPGNTFGEQNTPGTAMTYVFKTALDNNGFLRCCKPFCMDIDGIKEGEDPFGYCVFLNGKVIFGQRATEWLQKSIQEKE